MGYTVRLQKHKAADSLHFLFLHMGNVFNSYNQNCSVQWVTRSVIVFVYRSGEHARGFRGHNEYEKLTLTTIHTFFFFFAFDLYIYEIMLLRST